MLMDKTICFDRDVLLDYITQVLLICLCQCHNLYPHRSTALVLTKKKLLGVKQLTWLLFLQFVGFIHIWS